MKPLDDLTDRSMRHNVRFFIAIPSLYYLYLFPWTVKTAVNNPLLAVIPSERLSFSLCWRVLQKRWETQNLISTPELLLFKNNLFRKQGWKSLGWGSGFSGCWRRPADTRMDGKATLTRVHGPARFSRALTRTRADLGLMSPARRRADPFTWIPGWVKLASYHRRVGNF